MTFHEDGAEEPRRDPTPGQLPLFEPSDLHSAGGPWTWPPAEFATPRRSRRRPLAVAGIASVVTLALIGWGVSNGFDVMGRGLPAVHRLATTGAVSQASAVSSVERSIVDIVAQDGGTDSEDAGTGMVLTASGEVLTNNHVVKGATALSATVITTGRTYRAVVVGTDATDDVAVIKLVGASGMIPITAGDSGAVTQGTHVIAIGNAEGRGTPTVTTGAITAIGQSITASDGGNGSDSERLHGLFETDADIISGDSGGPLSDAAGQVIGMDTAAASSDSQPGWGSAITSSSAGYAIPIATALSLADKIVRGEASSSIVIGTPGMLGVEVTDPSDASQDPFGGSEWPNDNYGQGQSVTGADVVGVVSSGPAAGAGITAGDVITAVNGSAVSSASALTTRLTGTHSGDTVRITWVDSGGQTHTASVTLAAGPAA